jgi:hypothetical protein
MSSHATAANALALSLARDEQEFTRDAQAAVELLTYIAGHPKPAVLGTELSRLSQQVAELVRRGARITASTEAAQLMNATLATEK